MNVADNDFVILYSESSETELEYNIRFMSSSSFTGRTHITVVCLS